jgi:uncharacterized protein YecE (DUF72 family)
MMGQGRAFVGTSGWSYPHWAKGVFYPARLRSSQWLSYYSRHFCTVEVNSSFYRLPSRRVFEEWRGQTPPGFRFSVKASRFITHIKKLEEAEEPLQRMLSSVQGLAAKLGPLLFQLPPSLSYSRERLEAFLATWSKQVKGVCTRGVLEVRHPSWLCDQCYLSLSAAGFALCLSDWPELPVEGPLTTDFVFVRRHGPGALYASAYTPSHLEMDARHIEEWCHQGKEVYIYFNNDAFGWAVRNAQTLIELLHHRGVKEGIGMDRIGKDGPE